MIRRRRRSVDELPYIWAHRGLSESAPEDTISSWSQAADLGYGLEGDFRLSSDGVLVCAHDATVDRVSNSTGNVSAFTLAQLQAMDLAAKWNSVGYAGETFATLAQMIAVAKSRGVWAFYENSLQTLAAGQQLASELASGGVTNRAVLCMFEASPFPILAQIKAENPKLKTQVLFNTGAGAPVLATIKAAGIDIIAPDVASAWVDAAFVQSAHALGMKVIPYTVDTFANRTLALAAGVDGMITGRPLLALNGEAARGNGFVENWTGRSKWMPGNDWLYYNFTLPALATTARPWNGSIGTDSILVTNGGLVQIMQPLPAADQSYQIDTTIELRVTNGDATRWCGIYFALQQDAGISTFAPVNAGRNGMGVIMRQNGSLEIGKYPAGVASSTIATQASTAMVLNTPIPVRLTVTPTQITFKRLDTNVQVTVADATFRAGKMGLHWSNIATRFGPVTLTVL